MRKILILLLVIGILVGTCAVVEDIYEEYSTGEQVDFTDESPDGPGGPTPCGHEGAGGGGVPG